MRLVRVPSISLGIAALGAILVLTGLTGRHAQSPAGPETAYVHATAHSSPDAETAKTTPLTPWTIVADVRLIDADAEEKSPSLSSLDSSVPRSRLPLEAGRDSARRVPRASSCATLCVFLC